MGKVRLSFLISVILMLELSCGEKIMQSYGLVTQASYSSEYSNKNTPRIARVLESEIAADENIQKSIEQQQQGKNKESNNEEMVVSPEFIGAVTHNHNESQGGFVQNEGFDQLITQTYNDFDGYQVHSDAYGSSTVEGQKQNQLERLIKQVSPQPDNQRIPDITQLRNISIQQLPLALP